MIAGSLGLVELRRSIGQTTSKERRLGWRCVLKTYFSHTR